MNLYGWIGGWAGILIARLFENYTDKHIISTFLHKVSMKIKNIFKRHEQRSKRSQIVEQCQNCTNCRFDSQRGMICKLTDDVGKFDGECEHFEPTRGYLEQIRSQIRASKKDTEYRSDGELFAVIIGTLIFCIVSICWGGNLSREDVVGMIVCSVLVLTGCALCYLYQRHKREKSTFGLLSRSKIKNVIRAEGYMPVDKGEWIAFKNEGILYAIAYDAPLFILKVGYECEHMDVKVLCTLANRLTADVMVVKVIVPEKGPDEEQSVIFTIEALINYEVELTEQLPRFIDSLQRVAHRFFEISDDYNKWLAAEQEISAHRRRDIYNKEYHEIPAIVDGVTDGKYKPEALWDDESGLRGYLRRDCDPSMQAEWDAFRIVRMDNYGDYKLILYQFPEPKEVPEAVYSAVLLDTTTNHADYYTLEYSYNDKWVYGSTSRGKHFNYGEVDTPNLELFILWILSSDKKLLHYTDLNSSDNETVN